MVMGTGAGGTRNIAGNPNHHHGDARARDRRDLHDKGPRRWYFTSVRLETDGISTIAGLIHDCLIV